MTARSVMIRCTTPLPVYGSEHSSQVNVPVAPRPAIKAAPQSGDPSTRTVKLAGPSPEDEPQPGQPSTDLAASLTTGGGDVNLTRLLQALTDNGPFPVCAAQYLPDGVKVSDIQVTPKAATVTLTASDFVLDEKFLHSKGSCS